MNRICLLLIAILSVIMMFAQELITDNSSNLTLGDDSINNDSSRLINNSLIYNPDSLLTPSSENEIVIPYRSKSSSEIYPSHSLYKEWSREFLTPTTFTKSSLPDTFKIDVVGFEFPHTGKVTSGFGYRKPRQHYGVDIKVQMKDTIRAAFDGKVRVERYEARGYGYYMIVRHHNGLETIYAHLAKFLVKVDQYVTAGEPIALGDNTGRSSGTHLHFETRFMGNPIDPASFIDFNSKALLAQSYTYFNPARKIVRTKNT